MQLVYVKSNKEVIDIQAIVVHSSFPPVAGQVESRIWSVRIGRLRPGICSADEVTHVKGRISWAYFVKRLQ